MRSFGDLKGFSMRKIWAAGVFHGLVGGALFFATLHPLRDVLDAHALELAKIGGIWQAMQGLALMIIAAVTTARIPALLIAFGTAISCAMLYFIIFSGSRPPFIVLVPIGGAITAAGWVSLLWTKPTNIQ
jgi:uncharacterized membrane protein YgdD (TMEM256/DUF423 family)